MPINTEPSESASGYMEMLLELITRLENHLPDSLDSLEECKNLITVGVSETTSLLDHFKSFVEAHHLNEDQQLLFAMVLAPYSHPTLFYPLAVALAKEKNSVLGMINDQNTGVMYPTIQTLLLILYGKRDF